MLSRSRPPAEAVRIVHGEPPRAAAAPVRGPIRIAAPRRRAIYVVMAALWASGALWLVFHYFLQGQGEFGPEPSPLEPWWLKLHGAAAFAALWLFGLLWGVHVVNGWKARRRRWSGGALFGSALALIASGYLLYYAGGETLRAATSITHWALGLAAPALFLIHRYFAREAKRPNANGDRVRDSQP
jgi:hypothetical protein